MSQVFAKVRVWGNRNKYRKILSTTEQVYPFAGRTDQLILCVFAWRKS